MTTKPVQLHMGFGRKSRLVGATANNNVHGWMDERMDGWMDGWMHVIMYSCIHVIMYIILYNYVCVCVRV